MILWTSTYLDPDERRMREMLYCLEKNIANPAIRNIQLVFEEIKDGTWDNVSPKHFELINHPKVRLLQTAFRMTFNDWLDWANNLGKIVPGDPMVVANSDIYFDDTIALLTPEYLKGKFVCLSRRHVGFDHNGPQPLDESAVCAQDAWAFLPPVIVTAATKLDFTTGCPGCDNRLAAEMQAAGYWLVNPSISINAFHVHASAVKHYGPAVPGPHVLINPSRIK